MVQHLHRFPPSRICFSLVASFLLFVSCSFFTPHQSFFLDPHGRSWSVCAVYALPEVLNTSVSVYATALHTLSCLRGQKISGLEDTLLIMKSDSSLLH